MKLFFDTNVLLSAVVSRGLCQDLLRIALKEHDVIVSRLVLHEFERVLREKFGAPPNALDRARMLFDAMEVIENPDASFGDDSLDKNDASILAAAIEAEADVFVTGDKGLLELAGSVTFPVLSPRGVLALLKGGTDTYPEPSDDGSDRVSESSARMVRERAFEFALSIIALCEILDDKRRYVLSRQLLRVGTSIGANIEEASAAESRKDFLHKMNIASKEARESHYWLRLLDQSAVAPEIDLKSHLENNLELIRLLTAIVKTTAKTIR